MRNADALGDIARVMDVLAGAAGALAMARRAMVVKLQGDADDVVTLRLQQRGRGRGVDAAGHGDDDPGVLRPAFEIETVAHGFVVDAGACFPKAESDGCAGVRSLMHAQWSGHR